MLTLLSTWPQRLLMALVRGYRFLLSLQALETHGAVVGTYMTLHRLVRCQPFCQGGHDPVPEHAPALFRHLLTGASNVTGGPPSTSIDKTSP
jgi:uncharacterized protein